MNKESIDSALTAIQQKIVGEDFGGALADLGRLLVSQPDNTEALYMSAVCHRYLGQFDKALSALEQLKSLAPGHGRAHQEEGHVYRDQGYTDHALEAYGRACQFNPALEASFRNQLEILVSKGRRSQALAVKAQLDRLLALPKPLVAVTDLIAQGKLVKAEDLCRQFLQKAQHHVEAMRLL
ncbi:MAG: tetratricopeptide repeat protein, partial [Pseudomonadales bacterium]